MRVLRPQRVEQVIQVAEKLNPMTQGRTEKMTLQQVHFGIKTKSGLSPLELVLVELPCCMLVTDGLVTKNLKSQPRH